MSARGVERVMAKCEACMAEGNFYEAHQMFRTIYFRYNGQHKYTEAADILYKGALLLLQHNQYSSGADLSMLLLDVFLNVKLPVTDERLDQVGKLFEKMVPECPERYPFLTKAVAWSQKVDKDHKRGHPDLHQKFGVIFWQENNYTQARYHYLHSADGEGCAQMLCEFHLAQGFPSEVDMFITQAVLQYLCLKNKSTANLCFEMYTQKHPKVDNGPPYTLPLLNFVWMLLVALEGGKLAVFSVLCEKYRTSISRDPSYKEYLDQIGQLFFGVPPPQKSPQGLFGNMLQNMLGGFGGEDEEEAAGSSGSQRRPKAAASPPKPASLLCSSPQPSTSSTSNNNNKSPSKTEKNLDLD